MCLLQYSKAEESKGSRAKWVDERALQRRPMNVLNAVVELEVVPEVLKRDVMVPVYKRGLKNPLKLDSNRGH